MTAKKPKTAAWLPFDLAAVRRTTLFVVDIGVPVCVGALMGQARAALLAGICGLLFSFADSDGPLRGRLSILLMTAGTIAVGGALGLAFRGFSPPFWLLFIAATFAAGRLSAVGKAPSLASRHGAMALAVTSGVPRFDMIEVWYALGALAVALAARLIDHLCAGSLRQQPGPPRTAPSGGWTRFALAYAGAATLSLAIGVMIEPSRVLWVVTTTLVVMQPDARASYVRIVQRIIGTVVGVVAVYGITSFVQAVPLLCAIILVLAALVPHHLHHRYWLHTALIAALILVVYDLATLDPRVIQGLFTERLEDMLLGCVVALIGTVLAFPRNPPDEDDEEPA